MIDPPHPRCASARTWSRRASALVATLLLQASAAAQDPRDAFAPQAVTVAAMEARAETRGYAPGQLVAALRLPTTRASAASVLRAIPWAQRTGAPAARLERRLLVFDSTQGGSVALALVQLGARLLVIAHVVCDCVELLRNQTKAFKQEQ